MRKSWLLIAAATILVSACSTEPGQVLPEQQRNQIVSAFERFCMTPMYSRQDTDAGWRQCDGSTLLLYSLDNGQRYVGDVREMNRNTGELRVAWKHSTGYVEPELFSPRSDQALPGTVTRIASASSNYDLWRQLQDVFETQYSSRTMRR